MLGNLKLSSTLKLLVFSLFICAIFAIAHPASAATYYVANAGNDACDGTSQTIGTSGSCAWKTINQVNISSFLPGDFILFNRGDTWREQLTVPSSGSAGNPITFGSYGATGEKPVISGADLLSSFTTEAAGSPNYTADANIQGYWYFENNWDDATANANNLTTSVTAPTFDGTAGEYKQGLYSSKFVAASTEYLTRTDANLNTAFPAKNGQTTTAMSAGAWVYVTANNSVVFSKNNWSLRLSGANGTVDWYDTGWNNIYTDSAFPQNQWVHFAFTWNGSTVIMYVNGVAQASTLTSASLAATASDFFIGRRGTNYMGGMIDEAFVFNRALTSTEINNIKNNGLAGNPYSIYYTSASVQPNQVFRDGVRLTLVASKAALATGGFGWDAGNSRIYLYDNPAGHVIEASQRADGIYASNKNYITITGLTIEKANSSGSSLAGGIRANSGTNLTINNIVSQYNYRSGVSLSGTSSTVTQSTFQYNGGAGIYGYAAGGLVIDHNTLHHNNQLPINVTSAGIYLENAGWSSGPTIQYNTIHDEGTPADPTYFYNSSSILVNYVDQPSIIRYNYYYNTSGAETNNSDVGNQIYYNVGVNNVVGLEIHTGSGNNMQNNHIYNNTFYNQAGYTRAGFGKLDKGISGNLA